MTIAGGDVYGELLKRDVVVNLPTMGGLCRIEAELKINDVVITSGYDDVLAVNLTSNILDGKGAVWEDGQALDRKRVG